MPYNSTIQNSPLHYLYCMVQSEISGSMDTCYCKQSLTTSKRYEWLTAISNTIAFPYQWYTQSNNAPWTLLLEIAAWAMLPLSLLWSSLHAPSVLLLANAFFLLGVSRAAMSDCMLLCCWWQSSNTQIWHGFVSEDVYGATSALNYHNYYNYHVTFSWTFLYKTLIQKTNVYLICK